MRKAASRKPAERAARPDPEMIDDDSPELGEDFFARARPAIEVLGETLPPATAEALAKLPRRRGPQKAPTKELVKLRLDPRIVAHFRDGGPGWQTRINDALARALKLD